MSFLLSLALGGLNGLKSAFTWLFADARRWMGALLLLMALYALHERSGWSKCQTDAAAYKANVAKASAENAAAQKKLNDDQKAAFDTAAEKANATYEAQLAVARSVADRYKLNHRVQPGTSSVGPGATASQSDPAAVPENPAAPTVVYITDPDFDACVTDYTYAKAAYDWAQDLVAKGTAEFKP